MSENIFEMSAITSNGKEILLNTYRGKVLLIVNTASKCGFTNQYNGLEALYERYQDKGLEILAFPCNQFGGQEPGSDEEISQFCELNFKVSFPLFSKVDVNGSNAHPLLELLKSEAPGLLGSKKIKWNFTKFLVNREGKVLARYAPQTEPKMLEGDIEKALG